MKLRIKGNTVRIRLTRTEVERFGREGYIEASTAFVSNVFTYALQAMPDEYGKELSADFKDCMLTVYMPQKLAEHWTGSDILGVDTWMDVDNGEKLYLLLEKDFKAVDEPVEEQSDNYENPLAYKHN
jgi:hypothetical protein